MSGWVVSQVETGGKGSGLWAASAFFADYKE